MKFPVGSKVLVTVGTVIRRGEVVMKPLAGLEGDARGVYRIKLEETETAFAAEYWATEKELSLVPGSPPFDATGTRMTVDEIIAAFRIGCCPDARIASEGCVVCGPQLTAIDAVRELARERDQARAELESRKAPLAVAAAEIDPALEAMHVEACARAAHEVNRVYCIATGDASHLAWIEAPEWQRVSARLGVPGALAGATPEQSHESWLAVKRADGWRYGPVKNAETKEHPCFVPYAELPEAQRAKDELFLSVVRAVKRALMSVEAP